jgi:hypothetical protein
LEAQLQDERARASQAGQIIESSKPGPRTVSHSPAHDINGLMTERDELLKARDKLIQDLMGELKEKKTQLAKHEIEVWQDIERRDVWKQRLSKFGIRLRDRD